MWKHYYTVSCVEDALDILDGEGSKAKIIAGGTDLVLEKNNGHLPDVDILIDITRIKDLNLVHEDGDCINFGPLLTHNQCLVSDELLKYGFPLVQAAHSIGAPQIRNVGTVVGNLVTASPANDTITPLIALGAEVFIRSKNKDYSVKLMDFYTGVRTTILAPDEMVVAVQFKKMDVNQRGAFVKYLLRETHAISVVNVCAILTINKSEIMDASVTLGAVAPTIIHSKKAENFLKGKMLTKSVINEAADLSKEDAVPIDDIRSSESYRTHLIPVLLKRAMNRIGQDSWNSHDDHPVLLWGNKNKFITPINKTIEHNAIKGPLDKMLSELGHDVDYGSILKFYRDFLDCFFVDVNDVNEDIKKSPSGIIIKAENILLPDIKTRMVLAKNIISHFIKSVFPVNRFSDKL